MAKDKTPASEINVEFTPEALLEIAGMPGLTDAEVEALQIIATLIALEKEEKP